MTNLLVLALGGLAVGGIAGATLAKSQSDRTLLLAAGTAAAVGGVALATGSIPLGVGALGVGAGVAVLPLLSGGVGVPGA